MRVLDDPEDITPRVLHRRHDDPAPDFAGLRVLLRAECKDPFVSGRGVLHAPVRDDATGSCHPLGVGVEPELVAPDVEADVERLVEVGSEAQYPRVPYLRLL